MAIVRYTLLRLAVLAGTLLLFWLLGVRGLLLPLLALVVAALLAYLVLPRHADAAAGVLAEADARRRATRETVDEDAEDAAVDDGGGPVGDAVAGEDAAGAEDAVVDGEEPDRS